MSFYRVNRTESLGDVHLGIPHFFKYFFGWWCWVYFVAMNDRLQFGDLLMDVCRRFLYETESCDAGPADKLVGFGC